MGNLSLTLFISFAAPLCMTLVVCKGRTRTLLSFLLIGMTVCLFCGELNALVYYTNAIEMKYYIANFTPLFEEIFKALPILFFAFVYKPERRTLLECSLLVGVGFAVLENAFILGSEAGTVSVLTALIRGFGAGMLHGVCTLAVGYGMTFVHTYRKFFYTGTVALLTSAIIFHSIYNMLVQAEHYIVGTLLPTVIFVLVLFLLKQTEKERKKPKTEIQKSEVL